MSAPLFTGPAAVPLELDLTIEDVMADLDPEWLAAALDTAAADDSAADDAAEVA